MHITIEINQTIRMIEAKTREQTLVDKECWISFTKRNSREWKS